MTFFLNGLIFSDFSSVPPEEFHALFINRGSLLIINDVILQSVHPLETLHKKAIIKHLMKAVIGIGDVLLYFHGAYHWSYRQRKENMKKNQVIPDAVRHMYEEAAEFRFLADYDKYLSSDFLAWNQKVKDICKQAFEQCFSSVANVKQEPLTLRQISVALVSAFIAPKAVFGRSFSEKFKFWMSSKRRRLAKVFPYVAFYSNDSAVRKKLGDFFGILHADRLNVEKAYLRQWCKYGDINLPRSLKDWGVSLETLPL